MSIYAADKIRAAAIELRNKINTLYVEALPIFRATAQWTLNGIDADLPVPFDVKVQLDAYKALAVAALKLDWIADIQQAELGDELSYPPPPSTGGLITFDQTLIFSEQLIF